MKSLKMILVVFVYIVLLPLVIWNTTFGFHVAYPMIVLYLIGIYTTVKFGKAKATYITILFGFILYIAMLPVTLIQLNTKQHRYIKEVQAGRGLNTVEKANVWGLNMMMATLGATVYSEAAFETAWMAVSDGSPLVIKNDFFLDSPKIQKAIASGEKKVHIKWSGSDYLSIDEGRASLALNQCTFKRDGDDVSVSLNITYPKDGKVLLRLGFVPIYVEEGLFRYLTEEGWLNSYNITWTATLT